MQLSEFIVHLQKLLDQEGDMPVMCYSNVEEEGLIDVRHLIHWAHPIDGPPYAEIG